VRSRDKDTGLNPNNDSKTLRNNGIAGREDDAQRGKEEARK